MDVYANAITHRTIHANGLDFHVAVAGSGEKLALCLHGFPESSFSWRHQMPLLAQLGYLVWAPDLRGYGGSSRPIGVAAYSMHNLTADVAALIEASGAKQTVLIGHDWGALIAWDYAMFGRVPIAQLIIMNVPHPALAEKGLRTLRQLAKSWYIFFFQLPVIPEWSLARNGYAAKFAVPYLLATGFVHGGVGLGAFTDAAIADPEVLALAAKVKFVIDPDNPYPNSYTGHIRATTKDGGVIEERQPHLRGGAQEPLTRQDVTDKFLLNAAHGGWDKTQSDATLKLLAGLYQGGIDLRPLRN